MKTINVIKKIASGKIVEMGAMSMSQLVSEISRVMAETGYRSEEDIMNACSTKAMPHKLEHFINFGGNEVHMVHDDPHVPYITYMLTL